MLIEHKAQEPLFLINRWGSFGKATRIAAWLLRFIAKCSQNNKETSHQLTNEECARASNQLLKKTQTEHFFEGIAFFKADRSVAKTSRLYKLSPFIGDEGLLRVRCRLNFSDLSYDEKFPILLPKCHLSLLLVRDAHLKFKYAGVNQMVSTLRNQYWVIGLKVLAKRVKAECLPC